MKLIAGLGNPGPRYAESRHNIGFRVVDEAARRWAVEVTRYDRDYEGLVGQATVAGQPVLLLKPATFMNLSGRAVQPLAHFYTAPLDRILVIFDDLDLPFGVLRLREKGGAGGHNGMRSIIDRLGTGDFPRLRVGIGRPPGRMDPAAFVLRDFDAVEEAELNGICDRAVQAIDAFIAEGVGAAMNKFNSQVRNIPT